MNCSVHVPVVHKLIGGSFWTAGVDPFILLHKHYALPKIYECDVWEGDPLIVDNVCCWLLAVASVVHIKCNVQEILKKSHQN